MRPNQGPYRSVVDYDTEEQLFEALMLFLDDEVDHNQSCSAQMTSLLSEIRDGEPVQKVGLRSQTAVIEHCPSLTLPVVRLSTYCLRLQIRWNYKVN
jgi:hypothetical protein